MTEKLNLSEMKIPDGILHDQALCKITLENNVLTLSFETHFYPQDYTDTTFAEKYKDFTKCHIKCTLCDEMFCEVYLQTSLDKRNRGKMQCLSLNEFVAAASEEINKRAEKGWHPWEYLCTYVSPDINSVRIGFNIYDMKYKGSDYSMCVLELETSELEYIWE